MEQARRLTEEHTELARILTVTGVQQRSALERLLAEYGLRATCQAETGLAARRLLSAEPFDLVVVNTPLEDEHGEAVARLACGSADVILLTKSEQADAVRERIAETGVYLLTKPIKQAVFLQLLQCIGTARRRLRLERETSERLQRKLQDVNLENRAKLLLIQVLKLSESQAHRYIEKQAMDRRISKREVAEGIISAYES